MASLGHGEWQKALAYHPLSPLAMAVLLLWFGWSLLRSGRPLDLSRVSWRAWMSLGLALVAFNLLRWCGIIESPRS
jgi:ammonia channel protein AmtB